MKALDPRLLAAALFVTPGGKAADIGTDHGYLPIWLVENGHCSSAIAADVNEMPLNSAAANIAEAGLSEQIETCLTDGLDGLPLDSVTDIIIAGMGGKLISEILERHLPLSGKNLILQPMTQVPFLRRWLSRNGFEILAENPAESAGKLYTVLNARQTGHPQECSNLSAHLGKMPDALKIPEKEALCRKYLTNQLRKTEVILNGLERAAEENPSAGDFASLARALREVLA